jgi:hypothetical protein
LTSVKDFNQWKAKSAVISSQRVELSTVDLAINTKLKKWTSSLAPFVLRGDPNVWRYLGDTIKKAIDFDLQMNISRALFAMHCWSAEAFESLDQNKIETATRVPGGTTGNAP